MGSNLIKACPNGVGSPTAIRGVEKTYCLKKDTVLKECVSSTATGEKYTEIPLYIFLNSLSHKQAMLGVHQCYTAATLLLHRCYKGGIR